MAWAGLVRLGTGAVIVALVLASTAVYRFGSGATAQVRHRLEATISIQIAYDNRDDVSGRCGGWDVNDAGALAGREALDLTFTDLFEGSQVVVRDEANAIVAKTELPAGTIAADPGGGVACEWPVVIAALPDRPFYQIEVGQQDGRVVSNDELAEAGWRLDLDLSRDAGDEPAG